MGSGLLLRRKTRLISGVDHHLNTGGHGRLEAGQQLGNPALLEVWADNHNIPDRFGQIPIKGRQGGSDHHRLR